MREVIQLNLNGTRYCVLREDVLSVEENQKIHQLPLVQKHIAGMARINDRVLILADLCACIGLSPIANNKENQILLISEQDEIAGFAVEDECNYYTISDNEILSMPEYFKTPVIDKCIIHNEDPIPLINIKILFNHVNQTGYQPAAFEYIAHDIPDIDFNKVNDFRVIECEGKIFALPAQGTEEKIIGADHIVKLEMTPAYISGIMYYNMNLHPLINMASRMKLAEECKGNKVLISGIGELYGFQIDSQREIVNRPIYPLPPIVQSRWMKNAIINNNSIIPVIDPGILVSSNFDRSDEPAVHERYKPDSQFFSQLGREEVGVFEFSLLGICHSLPGSEVEDIVEFRPYRHIPDVQQIVIGVTEYNKELLPVMDLAMCFGKRSPVTPEWKMILVSNGDFRAFIVTESLLGTHKIPISMQRELPITLPNRVVYGCYPDERTDAIRLILNAEALAVYFDKKLIREISEAFAGELKDTNIGIIQDLPDSGKLEEEVKPENMEPVEAREGIIEQAEPEQDKADLVKIETTQEEFVDNKVTAQEPEIAEDTRSVELVESKEPEQYGISEAETEQVEDSRSITEEEPINTTHIDQVNNIIQITEEKNKYRDKQELINKEVKPEDIEEDIIRKGMELKEEPEPIITQSQNDSAIIPRESSDHLKKKYLFIAAIIIISLIFVFVIFHNNRQIPDNDKLKIYSKEKEPVKQAIGENQSEEIQEKKTVITKQEKDYKKEKPADSYEFREYEVKEGDTLYEITESYTGNGFDYWEVAKENKIVNPDLIFPRQKIRIKIKK